ncbi:phage tail assembly protein [Cellvibrio mixtus]|uniref:phage tail assembly protein n=1 Tax=Cellvibrio mixtus TaxID=39650 RepID=UPI000693EF6F|nr:phage tail assembly protein [Cellvibrio mixtus]
MNEKTSVAVTLSTPIKRGGGDIKSVSLRSPSSGELRGLSLVDLLQLEVDALQTLLPRISSPSLTKHEIAAMPGQDLVRLGTEVSIFLTPKDVTEPGDSAVESPAE